MVFTLLCYIQSDSKHYTEAEIHRQHCGHIVNTCLEKKNNTLTDTHNYYALSDVVFFSHFAKTHLTDKARRDNTPKKRLQNKVRLPVFVLVKIKHPLHVRKSLAEVSLRKRKFTFSAKS